MEENKRQGLLLIVSGPSGAGKGTVVSRLLENVLIVFCPFLAQLVSLVLEKLTE